MQAVLMIGFAEYEVDLFRKFMIEMDADMVKVRNAIPLRNTLRQTFFLRLLFPKSVYQRNVNVRIVSGMACYCALQIVTCSKQLLALTLEDALNAPAQVFEQVWSDPSG
jgi:hypothetical protein